MSTSTVFAVDAQREVKPFLGSLKSTPYEFTYMKDGLSSVHAVNFSSGMTNEYQPFFNRIVLQTTMNDGTGRIKTLKNLGASDFGTLGHEAFHAYKANYIEVDSRFSHLKYFLSRRADNLYRSIPAEKRAVTLEEAYASFIGWVLQGHQSTLQALGRLNAENCESGLKNMERIWKATWNSKVSGYWYHDSIAEYWSTQASGIGILIGKGWKAFQDWRNQEDVQMVDEDLQELDRRWVGYNIFEGTISEDFGRTFEKAIKALNCGGQSAAQQP
ncbi:MAG TPA: hypothetical protein PLU50_12035 [Pseudobdellovibrionaceae bacterium]|nr:hypothetical protein [Pseudobdellovibrionaceae bacterium]